MNHEITLLRQHLASWYVEGEIGKGEQGRPLWDARKLISLADNLGICRDLGIALCKESFRHRGVTVPKLACLLVSPCVVEEFISCYLFSRHLPYLGTMRKDDARFVFLGKLSAQPQIVAPVETVAAEVQNETPS